jgi:hypothetical protein
MAGIRNLILNLIGGYTDKAQIILANDGSTDAPLRDKESFQSVLGGNPLFNSLYETAPYQKFNARMCAFQIKEDLGP